jgi:hypothetical protein
MDVMRLDRKKRMGNRHSNAGFRSTQEKPAAVDRLSDKVD